MSPDGSAGARAPQGTAVAPGRRELREPGLGQGSGSSRLWRRVLLAAASVVVVGGVFALIRTALPRQLTEARLTHRITRGDLVVTVIEQGTLESSNNTEIKCKVRGYNTVTWVIDGGSEVNEGDELIRLDTKQIEDVVSQQTTNAHAARATLEQSKADVAKAEIAISAYVEGTYRSQVENLERELTIARTNLATSQKMLRYSEDLFKLGYVNEYEIEGNRITVTQAELELKVKETQRDVLEQFTQKMELETLNGNLTASKSKLEADKAGLAMDEGRRDRALEELRQCVINAPKSGLVIHPSAAQWKDTPDIRQGATVHKDQTLLLMPDLSKMQVKVGIHESMIDRIKPGMTAWVTLPDRKLTGKVSSVASVTRPAGWWTGNVVKYDTIIELPSEKGLSPGMSAEVEVEIERYEDVLTIPVAAVVQTEEGDFCWVQSAEGVNRRPLQLGDTDDSFIVVEAGVKEGDAVVLNPREFGEEPGADARGPRDEAKASDAIKSDTEAGASGNREADHGD